MAKSPENQEPGYLDGAERWPNFLTCRVSCHFLPLDGSGRPDYSDVLPCHPVGVLIYMLSCHRAFAYPYAQPLQEARRAFAAGGARAFGPGAGVRRSPICLVRRPGCLRAMDKITTFSTDWIFSGAPWTGLRLSRPIGASEGRLWTRLRLSRPISPPSAPGSGRGKRLTCGFL